MGVQDWWSGGELVPLKLSGTEQGVFVRREGSGPSMTLLHGFPSSSHDWAKVAPALAERIRERLPDAPFTALEDVAHWPPLEAPERVAATLLSRQS